MVNDSTHESVATAGAGPGPSLVLLFSGPDRGGTERRSLPRGGLILGRNDSFFDAPFDDARMSTRHAAFRLLAGRVLVRDLEGGTRVNGRPLAGERALEDGDVLRLGDTLLYFAAAPPQPLPPMDALAGSRSPAESRNCPEQRPSTECAAALSGLVGVSASIAAVRRSVSAVAGRKHTVVVTGETGTGKEVVSRLLHQRSGRAGPYVAVNCGTFSEGLLASNLFGHVRGAFTGAVTDQQGLFRAASGGTLLLDEVAEIPLPLQAHLLRVLEMNEVRPVGGTRDVATDVRVIATSNREMVDLVHEGRFRADLYSRLAQWTIRLPRLRERREDIPALVLHLLSQCDGAGRALSPDLAEALLLHDWPLNVRGLRTVLSVAVVSAESGEPLTLTHDVRQALWTTRSMVNDEREPAQALPDEAGLKALMERFHGKVAASARYLGITRPRLYRLLWARGIEPARFR